MKIKSTVLMLGVMLSAACTKNNGDIPLSGEASINSKIYFNKETSNYYVRGFSFSKGAVVRYERFVTLPVDLVVQEIRDNTGIVGAFLESPENSNAFRRKGEFMTANDAASFFNSLTEITDNIFSAWANPVLENEVWAIQTLDEKYAKIWIKSIYIDNDEGFVEVVFRWEYQPDGSRKFSK